MLRINPSHHRLGALLLLLVSPAFARSANEDQPEKLCPTFILSQRLDPGLNDTEKRLVCGDPAPGPTDLAWRRIPPAQARYNLRNFLQERAYLNPIFTYNLDNNVTEVDLGPRTRLTRLTVEGVEKSLDLPRKRKIIGEPLTPSLLGGIEGWVTGRLQSLGYACPEVKSEADPKTGAVVVRVKTGPLQNLVEIAQDDVAGLDPQVFRRYDAFQMGKPYDADLLTVTENRIVGENIVESTHFTSTCAPDGVHAHELIMAGAPRLLTFGAGINTEGLLLGKASWRNSRLGRYSSWVDVTALASSKTQSLTTTVNWYLLHYPTRISLRPLAQILHDNEDAYEYISTRVAASPSTTWDNQDFGLTLTSGPALDYYRTFRGPGLGYLHFLSLETDLNVKSHTYEFFQSSPRAGWNGHLVTDFATSEVYSDASAQRFRLLGEGLINFRDYDPPLFVFGIRGGAATVITGEQPGPNAHLPPSYFEYLGGSANLRGFGLQELTLAGYGALSSIFADFEFRVVSVFPWGLEPFLFYDAGALGGEPFQLSAPIYWNPGVGIRWASPVGVVRTTLAHGYPHDVISHWQFYFSFGEEF